MPYSPISRRRFLSRSATITAGAALAASAPAGAFASSKNADNVSITFGESEWTNSLVTAVKTVVIPNFEKLNPGISVSMLASQDGGAYQSQMLSRIAAGSPINVSNNWDTPAALAVRGLVEPLDDYMAQSAHSKKSDWPAQLLKDATWKGKVYALPITKGSWGFFFNQEWFQKKGIPSTRADFPKTWDGLRKLSKEFTLWKGDTLVNAGYVPFRFSQDWDIPPTMYIWSVLNGGQLYDPEKGVYTIDSEPNIAMVDYMLSWLNEEFKGDITAVDRSGNWSMHVDTQGRPPAFGSATEAMGIDGSWILGGMYDSVMKFTDYEVAPFPVGPGGKKTVSGTWPNQLVIPRGAKNLQEGFTWMDYMGSAGMISWTNAVPDLPSNLSLPMVVSNVVTKHRGKAKAKDIIDFFYKMAALAVPMWGSPVEGFFETQFMSAIDKVMHKTATPKAALAECQQVTQNQLKQVLAQAH